MDKRIDGYDWENAFDYAASTSCSPIAGYRGDASGFSRDDVAEIIAIEEGYNDGDNWIGLFRLKDGRFGFLSAGCDYTGWDCQASGHAFVSDSLETMIRLGLGESERVRLKLVEVTP